jgi:site-specific DNA-methyltransferase (cytosine-N4-specific)
VDLVVTSPPYFGLRSYQDGGGHYAEQIGSERTPAAYIDALIECTREWVRVLKPSGSLWVNLGDKYSQRVAARMSSHQDGLFPDRSELVKDWKRDRAAGLARMPYENITDPDGGRYVPEKSLMGLPWRYALRCIDDLGLILRAELIWSKPNGLPESVTDRVRRSHEQWFHLVKQPRYYSAVDEIRQPYEAKPQRRFAPQMRDRGEQPAGVATRHSSTLTDVPRAGVNPLGKLPSSVWEVATEPLQVPTELGVDHFAAFPTRWPDRLIRGWCPPAGVVLDPFGGTGTTALIAKALGRHGISVDRSADYCRLATWRTTDPGQLAKVLGVAKPPVEVSGQASLFDGLESA